MRKYLMSKAGYPAMAREAGIEGKVFVRFVVMPDGTIDKVEVAKDMTAGGGLKEAAVRAVQSMNGMGKKWTPGKQRGNPVPVRIMMPFVFRLN
jgi:protein TonB